MIYNWYKQQAAALATKLDAIKEGDKSILDNSVVLCASEIQMPNSHAQDNMPFMLLGSAGGALKTGRWLKYSNLPHNNLLLTLANAYGLQLGTFGKAKHCTGELTNLRA